MTKLVDSVFFPEFTEDHYMLFNRRFPNELYTQSLEDLE